MNERFAASLAPALSYYAALSPAAGFQGRCAMSIPADIEGKRVLDVCCRKGKGAFALADAVGPSGYVIGVDPDTDNVAAACAAAPKNHRAGSSWERHLRFSLAIPENLSQACIEDASFDLVYINSVLNLAWSLPVALAEFARVLAPGGRLWVAQGVFAVGDLDAQGGPAVIGDGADAALGNDVGVPAVGAPLAHRGGRDSALSGHATMVGESSSIDVFSQARSCAVFEQMCLEAGFSSVSFSSIAPLAGEDPCDGECPGGATFWLADACATI
ncbi:class I SAM-dependent methyltransferase [Senegalimassilia anaerobia]|uniref:class I SAM-dependent methyltransferase n=2 Tax=Senegalimassilia anaerobia TaxID=1473216 RepID=UPI00026D2FA5|nr:methyltransferase domain-containing protein [Senegalimassilia anaerobia]MEE0303280.1 methyltransferase domain-containing protein [Senegalimassilia anaerobia]